MKGDFSRYAVSLDRRHSRIVAQQGRVSLDADWNEQSVLIDDAIRSLTNDVLHGGTSARAVSVPEAHPGLGLIVRSGWDFDGSSYMDLGHRRRFHLGGFRPYRFEFEICPQAQGDIISRINRHTDGRVHGEFAIGIDAQGYVWFERLEVIDHELVVDEIEIESDGDDIEIVEVEEEIEVTEVRSRRIRAAWPIAFGSYAHVAAGYHDGQMFIFIDGEAAAISEATRGAHNRRTHLLVGGGMVDGEPARFYRGVFDAEELTGLAPADGPRAEQWPKRVPTDIWLSAGRAYVGGVAVDMERSVLLRAQPEAPGVYVPRLDRHGETLCAYADVFERYVDAAQDPALLEPALRGADTSGRARTVVQIRLLPKRTAEQTLLAWQHNRGAMQLFARAQASIAENALYRVEVHAGGVLAGSDTAEAISVVRLDRASRRVTIEPQFTITERWQTGRAVEFVWGDDSRQIASLTSAIDDTWSFTIDTLPQSGGAALALRPIASVKFSRDNASKSYRVTQIDARTSVVTIWNLPNAPVALAKGDWVELSNDDSLLVWLPTTWPA